MEIGKAIKKGQKAIGKLERRTKGVIGKRGQKVIGRRGNVIRKGGESITKGGKGGYLALLSKYDKN